ncbi:MAG: DUF2249 domain-containing protein [Verrucomicrobiota bacterium]
MSENTLIVDVREDIRAGREPFSKIMAAVAALKPGTDLLLLAPFEPEPLFHVLARQGFTHAAQKIADGDWQVRFSRSSVTSTAEAAPESNIAKASPNSPAQATEVIALDARGLEPPQPLVTILEAIETLRDGAELRAHTDRRPMHLYAQLETRGFTGDSREQTDGSFITIIRRR